MRHFIKIYGACPLVFLKSQHDIHVAWTSWLFGCPRFNGPLRQYFNLYMAVSQREGERKEE